MIWTEAVLPALFYIKAATRTRFFSPFSPLYIRRVVEPRLCNNLDRGHRIGAGSRQCLRYRRAALKPGETKKGGSHADPPHFLPPRLTSYLHNGTKVPLFIAPPS